MSFQIPRIDLRDFRSDDPEARRRFIETLGDGLLRTGFLTVGGHGLEAETTSRCYELFKSFFELPEVVKGRYDCVVGNARGYTPFGREHAKDAPLPDLKEFWHVGQELPEDHRFRAIYPDNVWPDELPEFKPLALDLYRQFEGIAREILRALALYFELPEERFARCIREGNSVLRVIHYPPLGPEAPVGAVRAAAHEDINFITLLIESRGGGLEILSQDGTWVPVHALEGDIIVDSGDMLSRLTNGVVPAVTHRVRNPAGSENVSRYSMPFFVHPFADCDLTVMERFVTSERPAQWPPITANEFLEQRLEEIGLLKRAEL